MGRGSMKAWFVSIALVVLLRFLFAETLVNGGTTSAAGATSTSIRSNFNHFKATRRNGPILHPELDPNYMSKRRVPNGPDPIHNRYLVSSLLLLELLFPVSLGHAFRWRGHCQNSSKIQTIFFFLFEKETVKKITGHLHLMMRHFSSIEVTEIAFSLFTCFYKLKFHVF